MNLEILYSFTLLFKYGSITKNILKHRGPKNVCHAKTHFETLLEEELK